MGYKIEYDMKIMKIRTTSRRKTIVCNVIAVIALAFGLAVLHYGSAVLETIIMGQGHITSAAAEELVLQIQEGASLSEAIEVFCAEVAGG